MEKLKLRKPTTEELLKISNDPKLIEKKKELDKAIENFMKAYRRSRNISPEIWFKPFDI